MSIASPQTERPPTPVSTARPILGERWVRNSIADVITALTEQAEALGGVDGVSLIAESSILFRHLLHSTLAHDFCDPLERWLRENRFLLGVCPDCGDQELGCPEDHDNRQCPACRAWWTAEGDRA